MFASLALRAGSDAGPAMIRAMRTIAANFALLEPAAGVVSSAAADYVPQIGNKTITRTNAAAQTVTVPTNATVAHDIGTKIDVIAAGAGALTIVAAAGVTINHLRTLAVANGGTARLIKVSANVWNLTGDNT